MRVASTIILLLVRTSAWINPRTRSVISKWIGLLGGLGNGAYQAVDLALAVDTLPDHAQSAQYMGIWGVGAFIGITVGPLIGGPLLFGFGKLGMGSVSKGPEDFDKDFGNEDYYPNSNSIYGYLALYFYSALCLLASAAILVRYVTKAR